jgi:ABC-type phosphate/phosphonate transport system permease subunit
MDALLIGVVCGLILGVFTARESARRKPVTEPARFAHYLGASSVAGTFPASLASLVLGYGAGLAVAMAIGFMLAGLLLLVIYAAVEVSRT